MLAPIQYSPTEGSESTIAKLAQSLMGVSGKRLKVLD
jgi:hypothetical protein